MIKYICLTKANDGEKVWVHENIEIMEVYTMEKTTIKCTRVFVPSFESPNIHMFYDVMETPEMIVALLGQSPQVDNRMEELRAQLYAAHKEYNRIIDIIIKFAKREGILPQ